MVNYYDGNAWYVRGGPGVLFHSQNSRPNDETNL